MSHTKRRLNVPQGVPPDPIRIARINGRYLVVAATVTGVCTVVCTILTVWH